MSRLSGTWSPKAAGVRLGTFLQKLNHTQTVDDTLLTSNRVVEHGLGITTSVRDPPIHFASTLRKAHRLLFPSGAANCTEIAATGPAALHVSRLGTSW
jgi:hypothetical protein